MGGKLNGKTVFITGASRGIGLAIALRCARDGANIVIAAKTTEPHPTLPGTIYTAAKEIEAAGGQCLPCVVDVRSEEQVQKAVAAAVEKFGGIDILINNASAIHISGTVDTPMKRYDLMNNINTRGTFLCSKACIPHLRKSKNPHILNNSPPLNMKPRWFKDHVAYTMAKYGMSMCVLGMAEELKDDGIAVNAIWPRTLIYTAASIHGAGESIKQHCRTPEIMADAAYSILTKDSRHYTGNFTIDDEVLRADGVTDFTKYKCDPNGTLMIDVYVEDESPAYVSYQRRRDVPRVDSVLEQIRSQLNSQVVQRIGGVYQLDFKGDGTYFLDLKNGSGSVGTGRYSGRADAVIKTSVADFLDVMSGKLTFPNANWSGKMFLEGNPEWVMRLQRSLKISHPSKL